MRNILYFLFYKCGYVCLKTSVKNIFLSILCDIISKYLISYSKTIIDFIAFITFYKLSTYNIQFTARIRRPRKCKNIVQFLQSRCTISLHDHCHLKKPGFCLLDVVNITFISNKHK